MADNINIDIKTRSIEDSLYPLANQISTLVSEDDNLLSKQTPNRQGRLKYRALESITRQVIIAVRKFTDIGEAIANDNQFVRKEMQCACLEATLSGQNIAKISASKDIDRELLIRHSKHMLSSVTKVLLISDHVMVRTLLDTKDKVHVDLTSLVYMNTLNEFSNMFDQFGKNLVQLAHLTGDRQADLKDELDRTAVEISRNVLDRSTMILLTTCKLCIYHQDCQAARLCRDGIYKLMTAAINLLDEVCNPNSSRNHQRLNSIGVMIRRFLEAVNRCLIPEIDMPRMHTKVSEQISLIVDATSDFTDSPYLSHELRANIVRARDSVQEETQSFLRTLAGVSLKNDKRDQLTNSIFNLITICEELNQLLKQTATAQSSVVYRMNQDVIQQYKLIGIAGDISKLETVDKVFIEQSNRFAEIVRFLFHVAATDSSALTADYCERFMLTLCRIIPLAGKTLTTYPGSKIAKQVIDVLSDAWDTLINDLNILMKQAQDMSVVLLSAGSSTTLGSSNVTDIVGLGDELKLLTGLLDKQAEKWGDQDGDMIRRSRNISSMAFSMYLYSRGEGPLKSPGDLFTQAEYFCEEGAKLYKNVKMFTKLHQNHSDYRHLSIFLDKLPGLCQQLRITVKATSSRNTSTSDKCQLCFQGIRSLLSFIVKTLDACHVVARQHGLVMSGTLRSVYPSDVRALAAASHCEDDSLSLRSTQSEGGSRYSRRLKSTTSLSAFEKI